jgi:hypothetical protein
MQLIQVRLIGIPLSLHQRSMEHGAEVLREFSHIEADPSATHAPARLLALHRSLQDKYRSFSRGIYSDLDAAVARGDEAVDLSFTVPAEAAHTAKDIADLWEEVDRYCEQGQYLLALSTPPDLAAYRRWFLEQFSNQVAGGDPVSWTAWMRTKPSSST